MTHYQIYNIMLPELHWGESSGSNCRHINIIQHCLETSIENQARASKWVRFLFPKASTKRKKNKKNNKLWAIPINNFIRTGRMRYPVKQCLAAIQQVQVMVAHSESLLTRDADCHSCYCEISCSVTTITEYLLCVNIHFQTLLFWNNVYNAKLLQNKLNHSWSSRIIIFVSLAFSVNAGEDNRKALKNLTMSWAWVQDLFVKVIFCLVIMCCSRKRT